MDPKEQPETGSPTPEENDAQLREIDEAPAGITDDPVRIRDSGIVNLCGAHDPPRHARE